MNCRKTGRLVQLWHVMKRKFEDWVEWQHAKDWARCMHPAWVEIATKSKSEEARAYYKKMILAAYRGDEYV